jgi:hypothetical protein
MDGTPLGFLRVLAKRKMRVHIQLQYRRSPDGSGGISGRFGIGIAKTRSHLNFFCTIGFF